jgi:PBSX family phage terminase large subunit
MAWILSICTIIANMEYELFDKQDQFVFDEHMFGLYEGGFGNGKTLAGAIKTYNHCMQKDAFFLIGRRHATDLSDSTERDFLGLFGHMGKFSPKNGSFKFYKDGQVLSEVIFRHLDDLQSLTNMNLSGFWIDQAEEVSEDVFDFLVGRIRRPVKRREGFCTANPNGHDWIWRRFLKKIGKDGKALPNASDFFAVTASTLENEKNLPEDYVKGLLAMPKEWVKRFVEGSHDVFAGQIYDEFNPSVHVIPPFQIPNTWERFRSIDHGQHNPTSCHWYAVDFDGNIFVYQEYYRENDVVSNHAKAINHMSRIRNTLGETLTDVYAYTVIDPSTHAKTLEKDGYRFSVADEYMDAGIPTIAGQNDVIAGINRVKEYLRIDPTRYHPFLRDPDGDPLMGAPRVFIFSICEHMIEEAGQYKWKSYSGMALGNPDKDEIKEAPVKRQDHAMDDFRYAIMSRPQSPLHSAQLEDWVLANPVELARRAQLAGMTPDDFRNQRFNRTAIRHSETGIQHTDGLQSNR